MSSEMSLFNLGRDFFWLFSWFAFVLNIASVLTEPEKACASMSRNTGVQEGVWELILSHTAKRD